jgi:demethylmenaquinone methyltransferase/2-methoxy-6-polyprenyl-1,4-benzoquinol methylase
MATFALGTIGTFAMVESLSEELVQGMIGYYRDRAPIYDRSMGYDRPEVVAALARIAGFLVEELRDREVLEIAAGPGFWTRQVAPHVRTLLATDVNQAALQQQKPLPNVRQALADAYDLSNLPSGLSGAFAVDWWSHVPLSKIDVFLGALHRRLAPGARVVLIDQLNTAAHPARTARLDDEGNCIEIRQLEKPYPIIKNYPSEAELRAQIGGRDIVYFRDEAVSRWAYAYTHG